MTPPVLLDIDGLRVALDGRPVLRGFSLQVRSGEIAGLVGESGAGKTMAGRAVLGLLPDAARVLSGAIRFDGTDLLSLDGRAREALLGRDVALIPQNPMTALNPVARIGTQIVDGLRMHLGLDRSGARSRAVELLQAVRLPDAESLLGRFPHELSGGMRQRVLIACAFACRPRLVIADEPTTALDVTVQKQCLRLIRELQRQYSTAVLFITHDLGVVAKVCDSVAVMHGGRVLESGSGDDLFRAPRHPYTRALLAATPRFDRPGDSLVPVSAEVLARLQQEVEADDAAL
jgi:peptide/nickel transport system ATP-binding protein